MRVCLFTDTLGDVNGVCRFIQNVAEQARLTGRELHVLTSTRFRVPLHENLHNLPPLAATRMPRYENLELALPPARRLLRLARSLRPDVIHVSTPGPVGLLGLLAARRARIPVLGVYHTDFPGYLSHLFDEPAIPWAAAWYMKRFYSRFRAIFTRSDDYVESLVRMGIPRDRLVRLRPGIDIGAFHPRFREESVWRAISAPPPPGAAPVVRVLYVGRVSVEKNLPLLVTVWKAARPRLGAAGVNPELIVVGDGPYRAAMQRALRDDDARFLGFRHGEELSRLYASSDLFVFPSTTDTLGQVVMESQASGLPVIVSDQGGPKEVVADGLTGFVLPALDTEAWVDRLVLLARDADRRSRMGAAAHAAMQAYSIRASFEHFWEVHARAAQTPRDP